MIETWAFPRDPIDMLVGLPNADAGAMAARRLAEAGHRRVAFIGRGSGRGALRCDGFRNAAAQLGLEIVHEIGVGEITGLADGRAAFTALLERGGDVDAVFCANDLLATGALIEARARGLSVPHNLALLGFGDNDVADQITPGLTTISFDAAAVGRIAGELLWRGYQARRTPSSGSPSSCSWSSAVASEVADQAMVLRSCWIAASSDCSASLFTGLASAFAGWILSGCAALPGRFGNGGGGAGIAAGVKSPSSSTWTNLPWMTSSRRPMTNRVAQ